MRKILQDKLLRADLILLLLYVVYCGAIILRVNIEGTGYTSPDSEYYLEAARSLIEGERFIVKDLYGLHTGIIDELTPFTAWPIGYPTLIVATSWVSGFNLFWSSKIVNLLFVGFGFLLLRQINRQYSYILASIFGSFTIIENFSYTWSEGPFIIGCLSLVFLLIKIFTKVSLPLRYSASLLILLVGMFLIRYITIFAFGVIGFYIIYLLLHHAYKKSLQVTITAVLAGIISILYLLRNYYISGHATGISRLHQYMESPVEVVSLTLKALVIEGFLIRNYYLRGTPDTLTIITTVTQIILVGYIWLILRPKKSLVLSELKHNVLSHTAIVVAITYLVVLVFLRSISQFDPPNYRLLSPFTFLMLFALVNYIVALPQGIEGATRAKYVIGGFFACSLLLNLPKKFLLSYLL